MISLVACSMRHAGAEPPDKVDLTARGVCRTARDVGTELVVRQISTPVG